MTTPLTGHWRALFDNKYLGAWNLYRDGRYSTVTVTIERLTQETVVMQGGRKSKEILVYFAGKKTPMILTKKMGKAIEANHGREMASWPGKQITLYVEQGFVAKDGPADVLRIRNNNAGAGMKRQLRQEPPPEDDGPEPESPEVEHFGGSES